MQILRCPARPALRSPSFVLPTLLALLTLLALSLPKGACRREPACPARPELAEGSLSKVEGSKADGIFQAGMIYVT